MIQKKGRSDLKVIERQIRTLDVAAGDLNRAAKYALGGIPGRGVALDAIGTMAAVSGKCRKSLASGAKIDDLRGDFAALSNAWRKVIDQMEALSPREDYYLFAPAGSMSCTSVSTNCSDSKGSVRV